MKPTEKRQIIATPEELAKFKRRSWIAVICSVVVVAGVIWILRSIAYGPTSQGAPAALRRVLDFNGALSEKLASNNNKAETFTKASAERPRFNGGIGLHSDLDIKTWRLHLIGDGLDRKLVMDDLTPLPQTEVIAKFKCVEGWSQVVQAKGTRFSEFLGKYGPPLGHPGPATDADLPKLPKYVGLKTPDGDYYVGIDMKSMLHPQTILCWSMDDKPLPPEQGFPLRLVIPIKYGIKHIKRIGEITLTNTRPPDYWYERGYDYYAGH